MRHLGFEKKKVKTRGCSERREKNVIIPSGRANNAKSGSPQFLPGCKIRKKRKTKTSSFWILAGVTNLNVSLVEFPISFSKAL